ncbi:tRNA-dihydrouridine(20a/20b) synthase [NAD(P)+]-like [Acipenser ruthenus]|uniref:tRNA-dihydrouridine(20a/20b) synthase [NAD(P)+]-like n=1 Tax=Acipenser ruthenus TaxID=7906 RepID=A0A662YVV7_ACIRT|nr:tRNA-dihydrouridine(20a/20b) synthase [NAD(P)+]-like [Acipenser ruthenus]
MDMKNPVDLFQPGRVLKICAPMVRYSKLAFRTLVRKYECDLCFTPMIIAESFVKSIKARDSEFTTNQADGPLIVQFAANDPQVLADAAGIVSPFADGVDLNCGCPQRTAEERHQPVHYDAIKIIKENMSIPVIANGDIKNLKDVATTHQATGVDGVMAARGLLANPAMFAGYEETPLACIWDWVDIALEHGTPFTCFHHHLMYMMERITSQQEKKVFNVLSSTSAVVDYLHEHYGL